MDSITARDLGSEPLRNEKHERFARMRSLGMPLLPAAREAGYEIMTAGNAAKIDRKMKVRAGVAWLCREEETVEEVIEGYQFESLGNRFGKGGPRASATKRIRPMDNEWADDVAAQHMRCARGAGHQLSD